jgi:hypothetical protein
MAQRDQARDALLRDLEAARHAAERAFRQQDAAEPANRLVAGALEARWRRAGGALEARWHRALTRVTEIDKRLADHAAAPRRLDREPISCATLANDLQAVRTAPTTGARLNKRIVRTVLREAMADLDDATVEIVVVIRWMGGAPTEHQLPRRRRGQRNSTSADVVEAVRQLALVKRACRGRPTPAGRAARVPGPG